MQVCYVVTGTGSDAYGRMAYLSAHSLLRVCKGVKIAILTGEEEADAVRASKLGECANEVRPVKIPCKNSRERSRWLKTTMRQHLEGDFLFLDADTLVVRPIDEIFSGHADLKVARDNIGVPDQIFPEIFVPLFAKLKWNCPTERYCNTGVMLVRDNATTHALFQEWHSRWQQTRAEGCIVDQPSFNSAVLETGIDLEELPLRFNAMIQADARLFRGAHILHFFTVEGRPEACTVFAEMLEHLEQTGDVSFDCLDRCLAEQHPWRRPVPPFLLWRSGKYGEAILAKLRKLMGRSVFSRTIDVAARTDSRIASEKG